MEIVSSISNLRDKMNGVDNACLNQSNHITKIIAFCPLQPRDAKALIPVDLVGVRRDMSCRAMLQSGGQHIVRATAQGGSTQALWITDKDRAGI